MPRNGTGTFSLPSGNPVVSNSVVSSAWANATMNDIAQALTDSLDRQGRGGMIAPFLFSDGSRATPGAAFSNEPSTGLYRFDTGDLRMSVTNTDIMRWSGGSASVWDGSVWRTLLYEDGPNFIPGGTADAQVPLWDTGSNSYVPGPVPGGNVPNGTASGQVPTWNGTNYVAQQVAQQIASGTVSGQVPTWNGSDYVPTAIPQQIADGTTSGQVPVWNGSVYVPSTPSSSNVPDGTASGQVPTWNGSVYVPQAIPVELPTVANTGDILYRTGGSWQVAEELFIGTSPWIGNVASNGGLSVVVSGSNVVIQGTARNASGSVTKSIELQATSIDMVATTGSMGFEVSGSVALALQAVTGRMFSLPTYNATTLNSANVYVDSSGRFQRESSLRIFKKEINRYSDGLGKVLSLNPVTFKSDIPGDSDGLQAGFIAEDVEELGLNELLHYTEDGEVSGVQYSRFTALLTSAIQDLHEELSNLRSQLLP